jgi:imidazole glycerol-phosphate synthase subunit HisH
MNLILNCGTGNFLSIAKMIDAVGKKSFFGSSMNDIDKASRIILPGVGSFDNGMNAINLSLIKERLIKRVKFESIPILGICLGMQLLCKTSEEGKLDGLGLVDANVKKFDFSKNREEYKNIKIPHMGWNIVKPIKSNALFPQLDRELRFYFVHSYKVVVNDPSLTIATTNYGSEFCSAFQKNNIFGVQFHPEKSHSFGMDLIKQFIEL